MMPSVLNDCLRGGTAVALLGIAIFFLRYWRETKDRFFLLFGIAFLLLTASQVAVAFLGVDGDKLPNSYWLRLAGFGLIITAIIQKNLPKRETKGE